MQDCILRKPNLHATHTSLCVPTRLCVCLCVFCARVHQRMNSKRFATRSPRTTTRATAASLKRFQMLHSVSRVQGPGSRVQGAGCRVQDAGCRVQGAGCRVQGVEGMGLGRGERICMWVFGRSVQLTCEHCWQEIKNFRFMPKNLSDRFFFCFFGGWCRCVRAGFEYLTHTHTHINVLETHKHSYQCTCNTRPLSI
jgi:hypothetical protein